MKLFEKIRTFKEALISAYRVITRDRDTAQALLENAILLRDKYGRLSNAATWVSRGTERILDEFSREREAEDSEFYITLSHARQFLSYFITVKKLAQSEPDDKADQSDKTNDQDDHTVSYLFEYNTLKGDAYSGVADMFKTISGRINTHVRLIEEKIGRRDFSAAVKQYYYMKENVIKLCRDMGINEPEFF